ncbi:MAG: hypothetical protein ACI92E_000841 [Oceanicoccus sp.]|jgi:hypothetical protein
MAAEKDLLARACAKAGLSDFGDDWFRGALGAWVKDLDGPHLSERGRAFFERLVVKDLVRRAQVIDCLKKNPEIEETTIPPILYITGHERSGTTYLHNLLSHHKFGRSLSRWELMMPTPPPEPDSLMDDPRRAQAQKSVDALKGTDLETMHWVNAHDPEECVWGFMDCTALLGQAPMMIMPTWRTWLSNNDLTPTFENYRKIIQILIWKNQVPADGFLVLKAPQITRDLTEFAAVFSEARFAFTHRDPYRVLTSTCNLVEIVNRPFLANKDYFFETEKQEKIMFEQCMDKLDAMTLFAKQQPNRVTNVNYIDLIERPVNVVSQVFNAFGSVCDDELDVKIADFIAGQQQGQRAKPRGDLSTFGYDHDKVLANNRVARYMDHFHLPSEVTRRTSAS